MGVLCLWLVLNVVRVQSIVLFVVGIECCQGAVLSSCLWLVLNVVRVQSIVLFVVGI